MDENGASMLSRAGNWAVVHLPGRRFPGIHVQGDTFAAMRTQLSLAARSLRGEPADPHALDDLDRVVEEMNAMRAYYEQVLTDRSNEHPY